MCYWDYLTILNTFKRRNAAQKGESFVIEGLPDYSKDMIKKRKELLNGRRQN